MSDLALAGRYFDDSARAYSRFARSSLCRCARRPGFERIVRRLDGLDHILFRVAPALRREAWMVAMTLPEPRASWLQSQEGRPRPDLPGANSPP
jgi:hypothetical protein